ncbi:MAG TPA: OmpA family protein [Candidatus Limnocylindria bacterium]|nr:OmpA family protein [Candidatus Limnocylindria bacterium]
MPRARVVCLAILLFLSTCTASRDVIVLLPDDQGKTGSIIVSGAGGEQVLSNPRQAVSVESGAAPGEPVVMPAEEVRSLVGPALDALPQPPLQFILYFKHDTAELTSQSRADLKKVLRTIRERKPVDMSVVGHTDTLGSKNYNYRLSLERAEAVAAILIRNGTAPSIIDITSHGKDNPLIPTGDQVSEPRNRRVEVTVR